MKSVQKINETTQDRILEMDLSAELKHGVVVSNLAYDVAKELGLGEEECYQLAIAGMLHDIGKLKLEGYINGQEQNPMVIEELKYVRMHSTLGYEILKDQGYSDYVLESILYHHENFDGSLHYVFGINYDITKLTLINSALDDLITPKNKEEKPKQITHSVNDLLDRLIEESVKLVGKPVALMNKEDKVTAIQFLNDSGAFLITKSGDKVANYFGISKYTLYSYIDVNK